MSKNLYRKQGSFICFEPTTSVTKRSCDSIKSLLKYNQNGIKRKWKHKYKFAEIRLKVDKKIEIKV